MYVRHLYRQRPRDSPSEKPNSERVVQERVKVDDFERLPVHAVDGPVGAAVGPRSTSRLVEVLLRHALSLRSPVQCYGGVLYEVPQYICTPW